MAKEKILFKDGVYYYQEGWKQRIADMTRVYVRGTDYQRGVQLGKLLAREIRAVIKCHNLFIVRAGAEVPRFFKWLSRWLPFLVNPILFLMYRKKVAARPSMYPAWMMEELKGMAAGAGVHPFFLEFINTAADDETVMGAEELQRIYRQSCCSFAFTGSDGNIYHGKNLDWVLIEGYIDLICLQQREDEEGNWFSIIGVPGILKAFEFGMNSHGLSIALTGRFYRGKRASRLVLTDVVELNILRYASSMKEIQLMYRTKSGFSRSDALLIAASGDRDYRLFEVCPMGAAVTKAENGILFNTNSYIHPSLRKFNKQWGNVYGGEFRDPRHIRLKQLLENNPRTCDDAFDILNDTVQPGLEDRTFLGQATINRFITHVSALMVHGRHPADCGVWIARAHSYAAHSEYVYFDYSSQPQKNEIKRPANSMVKSEPFADFLSFMHLRESRYHVSPGKLINGGRKLLRKEPGHPIYILFLAQNYLGAGRTGEAVDVLKNHSLEWCADYWYCLGQCHHRRQEYEKARDAFTRAMELPSIDGFPELVKMVCLVRLAKVDTALGLTAEVERLQKEIKAMQAKFATPDIGMPDYPYINNIIEQMEQVML